MAGSEACSSSSSSLTVHDEFTPLLANERTASFRNDTCRESGESSATHLIWSEALTVMKYACPIFGINILEYSLVVVSVLSIGHISTTALAAITLGEMTVNVTGLSIIQGFASALDTVLPSAWTSSRPQLVGLWTQRMLLIISVTLIPIIILWLNGEAVLLKLNQEPEVARLAALYMRYMCIGLPAYAFNCVSRRYFQCQGLFSAPTRIIVVVAPINVLMNYLLVWGPAPIRIGFIGAPIATTISLYLLSFSYLAYGIIFVPRTAWHPLSVQGLSNLGLLLKLGMAGVGQTVSEWWAWDIVALVASQLGSDVVLASQSILVVTSSTTWQGPFALGIAASIRIGNLLGERDAKRAGAAAKAAVLVGFAIAGLMSLLLFTFRNSFALLFNGDPEVVSMVASIIPLLATFQIFDATAGITSGILRARSKQVMGAILNVSAYYVLGIPFGVWLAFSRHMGLAGLWLGLTVALVYCAMFGTIMSVWTPDWEQEVDKVQARLEADAEGSKIGDSEIDAEEGRSTTCASSSAVSVGGCDEDDD